MAFDSCAPLLLEPAQFLSIQWYSGQAGTPVQTGFPPWILLERRENGARRVQCRGASGTAPVIPARITTGLRTRPSPAKDFIAVHRRCLFR